MGEDLDVVFQRLDQRLPALIIIVHYVEAIAPVVELQPFHLIWKLQCRCERVKSSRQFNYMQ